MTRQVLRGEALHHEIQVAWGHELLAALGPGNEALWRMSLLCLRIVCGRQGVVIRLYEGTRPRHLMDSCPRPASRDNILLRLPREPLSEAWASALCTSITRGPYGSYWTGWG